MAILQKGDKVGIISPSNEVSANLIENGIKYLIEQGFVPIAGKNMFKTYRWMAGTPQERADDINDFYRDPSIKAMFCARGGFGAQKILDLVDYDLARKNPKPIFGFSDNNALQLAIYAQTGQVVYTGFDLRYDFRFGNLDKTEDKSFQDTISEAPQNINSGETVIGGTAEGVLIGGCLSLFRNLCGTKYFPDLTNSILLIEDEEEKTYKIDLMLDQLQKCENFDKVRGIIFGQFANCIIADPKHGSVNEVIKYFCEDLKIPVIKNFNYGHILSRYILPIGQKVALNADACEVKINF
ncbi:MAG: LD-carboxypeptidase [Alphaproteobacteria bacterium]|nr:LD-carboxypeptidase [Alphaproteobacteria bacterium]